VILAGDIGGTHARLGLFEVQGTRPMLLTERNYPSREFTGLEEVLRRFLDELRPTITGAAFGVAGPVHDGQVRTPNLPWQVDGRSLASLLGIPQVTLMNDLAALAAGIQLLGPEDLAVLNPGTDVDGNRAVVAAGTGLGVAGLLWDGRRYQAFASEGGHADFAPRSALEAEMMLHLSKRFGRVSGERIVSGAGLVNIYQFLRDTGRGEEPGWLRQRMFDEDPAKVISIAGMDRSSPLCAQALDLFTIAYGAVAGNIGLLFLATGGVFLAGGIAPRVLARLQDPSLFRAAFTDKGRLRTVVEQIPVRVVLDDRVGLKGAAQVATFEV
jgi:glucokinase